MLTATVDTIVKATGGALLHGSPLLVGNDVAVDSREATPGCIFVALPGERVDGHEFVARAIERGARVLVVTLGEAELGGLDALTSGRDVAVVQVEDGVRALQDLAVYHRSRLHCAVVGITGSTGKTTTKDFVAAALATRLRVTATRENRNNELGVPLTVLEAGSETDVLVVEMGMRGPGQIAALCDVARPTHGSVTNIGQAHVELLGSVEAIVHAKGELVRACRRTAWSSSTETTTGPGSSPTRRSPPSRSTARPRATMCA